MLTEEDLYIIEEHIRDYEPRINAMLEAEQYYMNKINYNKVINHDFFNLMIEEKINYLLGKDPTVTTTQDSYLDVCENSFEEGLHATLIESAMDCSIKGITWLQAYIDDMGELKFMMIPSEEVIPVWTDKRHKELQQVIRYYPIEEYRGTQKIIVWKLIIYDKEYQYFYERRDGKIQIDAEKYLNVPEGQEVSHFYLNGVGYSMGRVPFVALKNNIKERSDLDAIKDLIDAYNFNRTREDEILEGFKNFLVNVKNYANDDENVKGLEEMLNNRLIFTDGDGGVEILTPNIDTNANTSHNQTIKDDIILFGQSVDRNKQVSGTAASGVALKALYTGLDLKCNALERQINKAIDECEYFIKEYCKLTHKGNFDSDNIDIVFNRDIALNEAEAVTMCKDSIGVISNETIVKNHPFVTDFKQEMKQIEKENNKELDYMRNQMEQEQSGDVDGKDKE